MSEALGAGGTERQIAKAARETFRSKALGLVAQLLRDVHEIDRLHGKRLSKLARWFVDDLDEPGHLVAVVAPRPVPDSMDSVLAYGLAWQGDADLIIVAPIDKVEPLSVTAIRLTCLAVPVRLFGYDPREFSLSPVPLPAPEEVLAALEMASDDDRRSFQLEGDEKYRLVLDLMRWADGQAPRLANRSRHSYRCWQYRGSTVLKLTAARHGVAIDAGSKKVIDTSGELKRYTVRTEAELTSSIDAIRADVEAAMEEIGAGVGRPDVEHRLQSNLVPDPDRPSPLSEALGLTYAAREFPAWRGVADDATGGPGLIDFLGIDGAHRLHVIETKANADDPKIVLQVLDYALWVKANLERVRQHPRFASATDEFPVMDFVCAPKRQGARAIGPYMAAQLDALAHEQRDWWVWLVDDPDDPHLVGGRRRVIPESPLVSKRGLKERPWALRVRQRLGRADQRPDELFLPVARPKYDDLVERHLTHRYAQRRYSSQSLCLNLFSGLDREAVRSPIKEFFVVHLRRFDGVEFEFEDPEDHLGERRGGHRHQTQVDAVLRGQTFDGRRWIGLVECKFTEGFSRCTGYVDPANDDREACRAPGLFGAGPARCFKLKPPPGEDRSYNKFLDGVGVSAPTGAANCGGCFVREELYQPMRSVALAEALLESGQVDEVTYALCAPNGHHAAWRRLAELQALFPDTERRRIRPLPVEALAMAHPDGGAAFRALYDELFEARAVVPWDPDNLNGEYLSS